MASRLELKVKRAKLEMEKTYAKWCDAGVALTNAQRSATEAQNAWMLVYAELKSESKEA